MRCLCLLCPVAGCSLTRNEVRWARGSTLLHTATLALVSWVGCEPEFEAWTRHHPTSEPTNRPGRCAPGHPALFQEEGWKLNRHNYYQEGWLATGNVRGVVGVTFTSSHCKKGADSPLRTNYNLRGHHSQVRHHI